MAKKKLIVVWPYRFRDFDWQRFELEQLSQHVEVHVHELIDALTPEFAAAYANQSDRPEVKRFSSLGEWHREFKKISKNSITFTHVRPINFKSSLICIALRRSKSKTIGFLLGGAVLAGTQEQIRKFAKLKRLYHFLRRNCLIFAMPDYVAVGGSESEERERRDFQRFTKVIHMNSFDYSQFLRGSIKDQSKVAGAVYLDTGIPAFPSDFLLLGQKELLEVDTWYPSLNKFFDFVEETLSLDVEVAVHPKHFGREHADFFSSRTVLSGNTWSNVAIRSLVIATFSTSISFAVCFDKPLILVWSDLIASGVDSLKKSYIENFAHETGAKIFNIDREYTEQELRDALVIDHAKRESYKRKYLTSRTDDKPNYQVLLDEVINVAD